MNVQHSAMQQLETSFVTWARTRDDIRAAVVIGSRARTTHPADAWSDLDILIVASDPERYLVRTGWLEHIGQPRMTFVEATASGGGRERRVLFEGGLDVDFAIFPRRAFQLMLLALRARRRLPLLLACLPRAVRDPSDVRAVFGRGYRVLLDKDRLFARLIPALGNIEREVPAPPGEFTLLELINDFWYHAVWTAKKLRRGELWVAKTCVDGYMKRQLLRMLEWHTWATLNRERDTWHGGRFLEEWADPRAIAALRDCFAHYEVGDVSRALRATMDLFAWLARETTGGWHYAYPADVETYAFELVTEIGAESP